MTDIEVTLNAWEQNYVSLLAVQGESDGRTIKATFIDRKGLTDGSFNAASVDRPIDLAGLTARLYCKKPDGKRTLSDGTITDATNGKASFVLPQQATTVVGNVSAQVYITKQDDSVLKVIGITIQVKESDIESIESSDQFLSLVKALNKADSADDTAAQAVANSQKALSDVNTAVSETKVATVESKAATQNANNAALAANASKRACDTATAYANSLTVPSIEVGTTVTGEPLTQAKVENAGTARNLVLNFTIPKGKDGVYQMINPYTGRMEPLESIVNTLYGIVSGAIMSEITVDEYDALGLTVDEYDAKNISVDDYDMHGKSILMGG